MANTPFCAVQTLQVAEDVLCNPRFSMRVNYRAIEYRRNSRLRSSRVR